MMASNGPPTPKGVGGPTPPLVSRGSEEKGGTSRPTGGPPYVEGGGGPTSPPRGRRLPPQGDEGGSFGTGRMTRVPPNCRMTRILPNGGGKIIL